MVGPLELFYDLAVVVLVAQAAHHLAGQLTWRGLGEFGAVFALVWIAWLNGSLHHELHGREDARGRSTFLLQIVVLVAMGAFIPGAGGGRGAAFAVATAVLFAVLALLWLLASRGDRPEYRSSSRLFVAGTTACATAVLFAVLALLWLLASRGDRPEYRSSSRLFVAGTTACAVLLAVTALLPAGARVLAWGLIDAAYLAGFAAAFLLALPAHAVVLTVTDSLTERFGSFTIIVLGETVTGVVAGLSAEPASALTLSVGLTAVVVGFGAWWTYFDLAGQREPRPARASDLQWMFGHLPLAAAVAAMGAAMVSLITHAHDGRTPAATAWMLCAGAAVVLCATMFLAASLQDWDRERALYRPLARTCGAVAAACLGVAAARPAPLILCLALVVLLGLPWVRAVAYRLAHESDPES